ncbi:M48 family metallopeptidase [Flavobacterium sp.]|uniref:M48 family metalloprotease n=1 Tax=Flavobacterium sp. TaxID=239 RepID=UPI00260CC1F7|nr:M48 family metallopeptidase [Flavobacterium sp.]
MNQVTVSKDFKQKATKAILSVILFVISYIILIAMAVALTVACAYAGFYIIVSGRHGITLMLGIGVMSLGLLVLFFLLKFVVSSSKESRDDLTEITREQEPKIFALIEDIVMQTGTQFPKHVYLTPNVNAAVFYSSGFWSMFLPVRKNLMIGIGLMNTTTVDEFKGILAHEFGHFSQRSMKVGSYVHNVNRIIHNMLFENTGYSKAISRWASFSGFFAIFVAIGVTVVTGIQWVLKQVYQVLNINYLALSREMEFHADEVAANVAGSQALATSLLRAGLSDSAYNSVLNFYGEKIRDNQKPVNIYPQQHIVIERVIHNLQLPVRHGLPHIAVSDIKKLNKSKLEFDDQWSSHPSDADRVARLDSLNIVKPDTDNANALTLFTDKEATQRMVTEKLFSNVYYPGNTTTHIEEHFRSEYNEGIAKYTFNKKYNGFYDELNLGIVALESLAGEEHVTEEELFGENSISSVNECIGLEGDIAILNQIAAGGTPVKTYDYDGNRYKAKDTRTLLETLNIKLTDYRNNITANETKIFGYYYHLAVKHGKQDEYKNKYEAYLKTMQDSDTLAKTLVPLHDATAFLNSSNEADTIPAKMQKLYNSEKPFKEAVKQIAEKPFYEHVNVNSKDAFEKYLSQEWVYFEYDMFNEAALTIFFNTLNNFSVALSNMQFAAKKDFLDYQAALSPAVAMQTDKADAV